MLLLSVGIGTSLLAWSGNYIDISLIVLRSLLCTSLENLLDPVHLGNLWCLVLDLTGTSERSMHFPHFISDKYLFILLSFRF